MPCTFLEKPSILPSISPTVFGSRLGENSSDAAETYLSYSERTWSGVPMIVSGA
jgi:hypothetical protein